MEIIKKSIILTFDELRILLYSQGYRKCKGIYMPEKDFSQRDIITALNKLEQSGLLTPDKAEPLAEALPLVFVDEVLVEPELDDHPACEEFYIRKDLLEMIHIIGSPDATEIIGNGSGCRLFCYYASEGIVTSEKYRGRRECVRLTCYNAEDFEEFRQEIEKGSSRGLETGEVIS